jgi:hypothetical protein
LKLGTLRHRQKLACLQEKAEGRNFVFGRDLIPSAVSSASDDEGQTAEALSIECRSEFVELRGKLSEIAERDKACGDGLTQN